MFPNKVQMRQHILNIHKSVRNGTDPAQNQLSKQNFVNNQSMWQWDNMDVDTTEYYRHFKNSLGILNISFQ